MNNIKNILLIFSLLFFLNSFGQKDSIIKVTSSWYGRTMPASLYTGTGKINDKISQNIEFGRSYGVIDAGICWGRMNLRPDTSQYIEARLTMVVSQYGMFSNEFTVGVGKLFNPRNPIMLEMSYSIIVQTGKYAGMGIVTGFYDFSGDESDVSKMYYGIVIRIGLLRTEAGGLLNKRMHHRR